MQERIAAPGVYTYETDQTQIPTVAPLTGLAVVGTTEKGKAFVPTDVTSFAEYNAKFGLDTANSYVPHTVYNYLQAGSTVKVTRILGNGGWAFSNTKKLAAIVSGSTILSVLHPTLNTSANASLNSTSIPASSSFNNFVLTVSGSSVYKQVSASLAPTNANYITKVLGTDAKFETGSAFPLLNFPNFFTTNISGSASASVVLTSTATTFTSSYAEGYDSAATPWVLSGGSSRLFRFVHNSHGFATNRDVKVAIANINVSSDPTIYTTFDVIIRKWNDTDKTPSIIEQYTKVNLNASSPQFIGKVIGDKYEYYDATQGKVVEQGEFDNISNYIRVELSDGVANGSINPNVAPNGFEAIYETIAGFTGYTLPTASLVYSTGSSSTYSGFNFAQTDNYNYLNPVPLEATVGNNIAFVKPSGDNKFILPFQGGTDGVSYSTIKKSGGDIADSNLFGYDLSSASAGGAKAYIKALDILNDTKKYPFELLVLPGVIEQLHSTVTAYAEALVEERQDAVYLRDLTVRDASVNTAIATVAGLDSSYSATYYPWVKVKDIGSSKDLYVPPTVLIPQVIAYTESIGPKWKAAAGTTRGTIGGAINVKNSLKDSEVGFLYDANINCIVKYPDTEVIVWGQKTLQKKESLLDRLNVRFLMLELKRKISSIARNLVFEQNTSVTRNKFLSQVNPYLETVQQGEGIYAYKVVMDETNNPNSVIDRNELVGEIIIYPTPTAEFIILPFTLTTNSAIFG